MESGFLVRAWRPHCGVADVCQQRDLTQKREGYLNYHFCYPWAAVVVDLCAERLLRPSHQRVQALTTGSHVG